VPREIARVSGGAGLARAGVDLAERLALAVGVAGAGPQRRAVAEDDADAGVERRLVKRVMVRQDVLERAFGAAIGGAELVVEAAPRAAEHAGVAAPAVEAAAFDRLRRVARRRAPGDHLHHRSDRVRSVQRRLTAAHDLEAIDLRRRHAAEVELAAARVDAHAVDQHQVVVRLAAAREQRRQRALTAGALDVEAGHHPQHIPQRAAAERLDVRRREQRDRPGRRRPAFGNSRRGDDHFVGDRREVQREVVGRRS
jgi:hypothetical protein